MCLRKTNLSSSWHSSVVSKVCPVHLCSVKFAAPVSAPHFMPEDITLTDGGWRKATTCLIHTTGCVWRVKGQKWWQLYTCLNVQQKKVEKLISVTIHQDIPASSMSSISESSSTMSVDVLVMAINAGAWSVLLSPFLRGLPSSGWPPKIDTWLGQDWSLWVESYHPFMSIEDHPVTVLWDVIACQPWLYKCRGHSL